MGHEYGGIPGCGGNVRNGHSAKTVRTEIGDVPIKVPRDRNVAAITKVLGTSEPCL